MNKLPYNSDNVFQKIIQRKIPAKIIFENDLILAFYDINPVSPLHILIIPKKPYIDFADFHANASSSDISNFWQKVAEIAKKIDTKNQFRLITNNGSKVGQTVFHFHVHLIAEKELKQLI